MRRNNVLLIVLTVAVSLVIAGCSDSYSTSPTIVGSSGHLRPKPAPKPTLVKPQYKPLSGGSLTGKTVVIDAGHGGRDPGAGEVGYSPVPEKVINLDIAIKLERELKSRGAKVVMSRNCDEFIELDHRAALAERHNADLLISIHADSAQRRSASGASIYIANGASSSSRKVARSINNSLKNSGVNALGIRQADFRVLVKHSKPAVLIETGYLTNPQDAQRLNNSWYRRKLVKAIANGVTNGLASRYSAAK